MPTPYPFKYSAMALTAITSTVAYGGYYGVKNGGSVSISGNATAGTDVSTEYTKLVSFAETFPEQFTVNGGTYTGGDTSFDPFPTYYTISTGAIGKITFTSQTSSDLFLVYSLSDIDLSNITFNLGGSAQDYNIYIICLGDIILKGENYGNIFADNVTTSGATVNGSVNALNGSMSGLTVRLGSPKYTFTYSAISYNLATINVRSGKVGYVNTATTVNLFNDSYYDQDNVSDEIDSLKTFMETVITFVNLKDSEGNLIYSMIPIEEVIGTRSYDVFPISKMNWYTIEPNIEGRIELHFTGSSDDVYYIVNTSDDMDLTWCKFYLNDASAANVYIISSKNIKLSVWNSFGNFMCGTNYEQPSLDSEHTIIRGSLAATGTSSTLCINEGDTSLVLLTINFAIECFMKGTKILTDQWYVPVEELKVGDMVMTYGEIHDRKYQADVPTPRPIVSIRKQVRKASRTASPIVFCKHAFAPNRPFESLYVSPKHGMITREGVKCRADKFINDSTIYQDPTIETVTYYHLELAAQCAIMANGVLTETWRDSTKKNT